jgi:hypothetical protein
MNVPFGRGCVMGRETDAALAGARSARLRSARLRIAGVDRQSVDAAWHQCA